MILTTQSKNGAIVKRSSLTPQICTEKSDVKIVFRSIGLRLDNHNQLLKELDLPAGAAIDTLLMAAWNNWREGMADRLRGAFAFALFDTETGQLYCARDIFGLSPFYYAIDKKQIYLGSSSRIVRSLRTEPSTQNLLMIADFLTGTLLEKEQTFFEEILRLPPNHWMIVDGNGVTKTSYWSVLDAPRDQVTANPPQEFKTLFDRAVEHCNLAEKTTLMVSGGLDSSAIAGALRSGAPNKETINCIAMTFRETSDWHDKPHLEQITKELGLDTVEVPSDNHDPFADMEHWLSVMDGPYLPYGQSISFRLMPIARDMGFTRVLSGHGGDEVVSYGFGYLNELAKNGKWLRLWRATRAASGLYRESHWLAFKRYLPHLAAFRFFRALRFWKKAPHDAEQERYLSQELSQQIDLERYADNSAASKRDHDERMLQEEALSSPLQPLSLEVFALCSEASGVETHLPFYDRELVELSLSLPADWKLRDGLSRYILRAAMSVDLPSKVVQRSDKFDFGGSFMDGMLVDTQRLLRLTDPKQNDLSRFVNAEKLSVLRDKIARHDTHLERTEAFFLWRVAVLGMWLNIANIQNPCPTLAPIDEA